MKKINIEYLNPKIWVFKNIFQNSKEMINYFENTKPDSNNELQEWTEWYVFGLHTGVPHETDLFDKYPSKEEWDNKIVKKTKNIYAKEMCEIFYQTTTKYIEDLNINLPNWQFDPADLAKYYPNSGINKNIAMVYHTDYERGKNAEPGGKFAITALFYLNDDYDNGEICFRILNDDCSKIIEEITYKPSMGDVVVFPSGDPRYMKSQNFFHGVKQVSSGTKYFIRSYWKYMFEGEPEYWKEKELYDEESWGKILKDRRLNDWDEVATLVNENFL